LNICRDENSHVVSDRPTEKPARKRPWLAAVLTIVVPGLGHAYLRLWTRAVLWFLLIVGAVGVLVPGWFGAGSLSELLATAEGVALPINLVLLAASAVCVLDAYLMATRLNDRALREHRGETTTTCPECGKELDDDLRFCHWCTTRLDEGETSP
jgi:hypothetical protein